MDKNKIVNNLSVFNEKVVELSNSKLFKDWDYQKTMLDSFESNKYVIPSPRNDEEIKAFILTLRLFIQNNEKISLGNLSKIYACSLIDDEESLEFERLRGFINNYLDLSIALSKESLGMKNSGKEYLTYRDLFESFVYGNYAHLNKREDFLKFINSNLSQESVRVTFLSILCLFSDFLFRIKDVNEIVIEKLNNKKN